MLDENKEENRFDALIKTLSLKDSVELLPILLEQMIRQVDSGAERLMNNENEEKAFDNHILLIRLEQVKLLVDNL